MKHVLSHLRITAATRLAIGLTMLCVSLLLVSSFLGLLPNRTEIESQATARLCESIALQMVATDPEQLEGITPLMESILAREPNLRSVGLRQADGTLLIKTADHPEAAPGEHAKHFLFVPISQADENWATAEFGLQPDQEMLAYFHSVLVVPKLVLFVGASCLLAFGLYLRRALKYLDPKAIVPERVRAAFDTMNEGVLLIDHKRQIALANQAFLEMSGKSNDQIVGAELEHIGELAVKAKDQEINQIWESPLKYGETVQALLCTLTREDGEEQQVNVSATPIRADGNAAPRGVLITFDDVTEIERKNAELRDTVRSLNAARDEIEKKNQALERLATTDPLTGVINRRAFFERGQSLRLADMRGGRESSVIILDIDHFKSVNDNHGHACGDEVLKGVAGILSDSVRSSDMVCRYGGEEFCIFLPDTSQSGAIKLADDLRLRIASSTQFGFPVTASFGAAACYAKEENLEQTIDRADQALYKAKEGGRNRVIGWAAHAASQAQKSEDSSHSPPNKAAG